MSYNLHFGPRSSSKYNEDFMRTFSIWACLQKSPLYMREMSYQAETFCGLYVGLMTQFKTSVKILPIFRFQKVQ